MSGGLTEAKSLRRLTQAFLMAALCCSLGSVTVSQSPRQAFYSARVHSKSLFVSSVQLDVRRTVPSSSPESTMNHAEIVSGNRVDGPRRKVSHWRRERIVVERARLVALAQRPMLRHTETESLPLGSLDQSA